MSTDLQSIEEKPVECVADSTDNLQLIARTPAEMRQATGSLAAWMAAKVDIVQKDADELAENIAIAERNNWKTDALKRQHRLCVRRVAFYEKLGAALRAGYCIVPNFPIDLIAIRTTQAFPRRNDHHWKNEAAKDVKTNSPDLGDGVNVSSVAHTRSYTDHVYDADGMPTKKPNGEFKVTRKFYPSDFDCEIEFPIALAKPEIMSATAEAMALKCFDEIGVLGVPAGQTARGKRPDPMVVGRIIDPRSTTYNKRYVSFVLAWYIDTATL